MPEDAKTCRHCGAQLKKWRVPEGATWDEEYFLVCFNDDCSYFRNGWNWMQEQFGQRASFRFAINPTHGGSLMIPVWSATATREMIVDDGEEAGAA